MPTVDVVAVVAGLQADGEVAGDRTEREVADIGRLAAEGVARLVLLFLVAVDRVVQIMGEVVPQGHGGVDHVGAAGEAPAVALGRVVARQAVTFRQIAVCGIQRAEPADQALAHRAGGLVGGEVAGAFVEHAGEAVAVHVIAVGVADRGVDAVEIVRMAPGPVQVAQADGAHQSVAVAELLGAPGEHAAHAQGPDRGGQLIRQVVGQADVGGGDRAEISHRRVIGPLGVIHALHELGHHEVDVRIALAVGVGRAVDRHVVDEVGDVGAVVQVEAADQVLIGLALARVSGDHQARHALQQLAHPIDRTQLQLLAGDRALAGGDGLAQKVGARGGDHHLIAGGRRARRGLRPGRLGAQGHAGRGQQERQTPDDWGHGR